MIPTINVLTERIHRLLKRGDVQRDSGWDPRDIEYLIRDAASKAIKGSWFESRNDGGKNIDSRFVATFIVEVKVDAYSNNYIDLPISNWIQLPDESGIQSVRPDFLTLSTKKTKMEELRAFIPIPNRFYDIYSSLPEGALEGQHGFMVRKNKIFFTKRYDKTLIENSIKKVELDVVTVDPAAVGLDEPLPIPAEMIMGMILEILQLLGMTEQKAKDLTNNENPNA